MRRRRFRRSGRAGAKNNAQTTRAELGQTVLTKRDRRPRRRTASLRSVSVGASRPVVSSSTKILARGYASARASSIGGRQGAGWRVRAPRYTAEIVELFSRQGLRSIP